MKTFLLSLVLAGLAIAARLEPMRLAPEASVWFEPNHGQVGGRTDWTARAAGAWLFLTSNEVVYALAPDVTFDPKKTRGVPTAKTTNMHMRIVGGRRVKGVGENATGGYSNYFVGKHEDEWFSGVPHFGQVRYAEVYQGIDVVFYANGRNVEYDFIVKPGADPGVIELCFDGAVSIDGRGNLVVSMGGKSFRQHRPRVFQGTFEIDASYRLTERGTVKVEVEEYDPLISLRVDPVLDFSTYLGGPGEDYLFTVTTAPDGNAVIAGATQSPASPVLDPFQQPSIVTAAPIVMKLSADGRRVLYYTILGRNGWDVAHSVTIGKDEAILVTGSTRSDSFPTKNAFQTKFRAIWDNGFAVKLTSNSRSLVYATYVGGGIREIVHKTIEDSKGNGWFLGYSESSDFPLKNALQQRYGGGRDAVLVKLAPSGDLLFSTYYGGSGSEHFSGLLQLPDGSILMGGGTSSADLLLKDPTQDLNTRPVNWSSSALVRLSDDGYEVLDSTFFGGPTSSWVVSMALDGRNNLWLAGSVYGRGFPVKDPFQPEYVIGTENGYLMELDPAGRNILRSTYLNDLQVWDMVIDKADNVYVGGLGVSREFVLKSPLQTYLGGGINNADHAVMMFARGGSMLLYSTLMGGRRNEQGVRLAVAADGSVFAVGVTTSVDYPTRNAYQPEPGGYFDGVFFRLTDNSAPPLPVFTANPSQLAFRFVQEDSFPLAQPVVVNGNVSGLMALAVEPWLRVSPSFSVSVNPVGLAPGIYGGTIRLTPPTGATVSVPVTLTVLAAAPVLVAVEPARVPIGTDDTEITIRGSGFTNRTTVQLQTLPWLLSPVRFVDSTTLRLTLPKPYFSGEYNHSITVQNPDSAISKPVSLAVGRPAPNIANKGIVSAASYAGDVISPGEILTLFGENFEPGMRVNFDGLLATPLYITPTQMSVVAPAGLAGAREANVIVEMNFDWRSTPFRIPVWPARPGLFTSNATGKGPAAAHNQDGSLNTAANPAKRGEIVVLWGTGGGVESLPQEVFIDGIETEVLYAAGKDGLWQLNVRIPEFASTGEVVWRAGERESMEGVFVALQN